MGAAVHGDELFEWKLFKQKSKKHANKLIETRPDIVSKLNDLNRSEKERESQTMVSGNIMENLGNGCGLENQKPQTIMMISCMSN